MKFIWHYIKGFLDSKNGKTFINSFRLVFLILSLLMSATVEVRQKGPLLSHRTSNVKGRRRGLNMLLVKRF